MVAANILNKQDRLPLLKLILILMNVHEIEKISRHRYAPELNIIFLKDGRQIRAPGIDSMESAKAFLTYRNIPVTEYKRKVGEFQLTFIHHGSTWIYKRNYSYRKSCLHTSGPSYIHEHDTKTVGCWSWDESGFAIYVQWKQRKEMADLLRAARRNMRVIAKKKTNESISRITDPTV